MSSNLGLEYKEFETDLVSFSFDFTERAISISRPVATEGAEGAIDPQ